MKNLFVLGGLACALLVVPASAKERTWQTGKVTEISSERFLDNPSTDKGIAYTSQGDAVTYDKGVVYTVQAGEFSYVAVEMSMSDHRLKDHRAKVNDAVQFAVMGETGFFMMGNDGNEHRMQLLKRTARMNPETPPR